MQTETSETRLIEAPQGVVVSIDENAGFAGEVIVTYPTGVRLPQPFVRACHNLAGNEGMGIRFFKAPPFSGALNAVIRQLESPDVLRVEFSTGGDPEIVAYKL